MTKLYVRSRPITTNPSFFYKKYSNSINSHFHDLPFQWHSNRMRRIVHFRSSPPVPNNHQNDALIQKINPEMRSPTFFFWFLYLPVSQSSKVNRSSHLTNSTQNSLNSHTISIKLPFTVWQNYIDHDFTTVCRPSSYTQVALISRKSLNQN